MGWKYQWKSNGGGNDPRTCRLYPNTGLDEVKTMDHMLQYFGVPKYFEHRLGPGLYWENGGAWGVWVLTTGEEEE